MFLDANIFQPLIDVFEAVLKFFHNTVGVPWGWSIVLLTVTIRAVLSPLAVKQFHSMQRLQAHQPEMKALQQKYKDDKERQNQEMLKFYRENQINPLASCLPLAAQVPVFISLYYMLRNDLRTNICPGVQEAFRSDFFAKHGVHTTTTVACGPHHGANFLFINDLTNSAHGVVLVVLILLYVTTQLGSSLLMMSPTMDRNQRYMMMALPLIFVFIVIGFPSGVLVYWITTNSWQLAQSYYMKTRIGHMAPAVASSGPAVGARGRPVPPKQPKNEPPASANGAGESGGGLGSLLRGKSKEEEPAKVSKGGAPPPPPRKKKKRSGRRR
jgi:YidC/Oxa1 family membrane protein insertase